MPELQRLSALGAELAARRHRRAAFRAIVDQLCAAAAAEFCALGNLGMAVGAAASLGSRCRSRRYSGSPSGGREPGDHIENLRRQLLLLVRADARRHRQRPGEDQPYGSRAQLIGPLTLPQGDVQPFPAMESCTVVASFMPERVRSVSSWAA